VCERDTPIPSLSHFLAAGLPRFSAWMLYIDEGMASWMVQIRMTPPKNNEALEKFRETLGPASSLRALERVLSVYLGKSSNFEITNSKQSRRPSVEMERIGHHLCVWLFPCKKSQSTCPCMVHLLPSQAISYGLARGDFAL
jgi:hypothetical protein